MPEPLPTLPPRAARFVYHLAAAQLINWEAFEAKGATGAETADAASEALDGFLDTRREIDAYLTTKPTDAWEERAMRCMLIILDIRVGQLRKLL